MASLNRRNGHSPYPLPEDLPSPAERLARWAWLGGLVIIGLCLVVVAWLN